MTEVPAHILERTRQRRLALGLPVSGGGDAPASGGAAVATATAVAEETAPAVIDPAVASAIAEAPPSEVVTTEDSPAVKAAKSRRKAPWWAIVALVALPLWGFFYLNSLERPVSEPALIAAGRSVYAEAGCAGCHGADGEGGAGPNLHEIQETFPTPAAMGTWIRIGTAGWTAEYGADVPYGAQGRLIGETMGAGAIMPGHDLDKLGDEELLEVVMFIRQGMNDAPLTATEAEEPSDTLESYEIVGIDEAGSPIIDPEAEFAAVPGEGEPLWEEFIAVDGGDLVVE